MIQPNEDSMAIENNKTFDMTYKLKDRNIIREAILTGDIRKVIKIINKDFRESKKCNYLILS